MWLFLLCLFVWYLQNTWSLLIELIQVPVDIKLWTISTNLKEMLGVWGNALLGSLFCNISYAANNHIESLFLLGEWTVHIKMLPLNVLK